MEKEKIIRKMKKKELERGMIDDERNENVS